MSAILTRLKGFRTHASGLGLMLVQVLFHLGYITEKGRTSLSYILAGSGLIFLRLAVSNALAAIVVAQEPVPALPPASGAGSDATDMSAMTITAPVIVTTSLRDEILRVARSLVGVMEVPLGSNWGPRIKTFLLCVGIATPSPWCAGYVAFCIQEGAKAAGVKSKWLMSGSCTEIANWAKKEGRLGTVPRVGSVFLVKYPLIWRFRHTGFVTAVHFDKVSGNTYISTDEGNSNNDGSSEGIGVFARPVRKIGNLRFVDPC